jgi:hypothetical protein
MAYFVNILLFLVLAITSVVAWPQDTSTKTPNGGRSRSGVDVTYDTASEITTVKLRPMIVIHTSGVEEREELKLSVSFSYPRQTIVTPKTVKLLIYSLYSGGAGFEDDRRLIVTTDGKRTDLGNMNLLAVNGFTLPFAHLPWIAQDLALSIDYADFVRISRADKVNMVVGRKKFSLSDKQIRSLRDLAELMERQGQNLAP